MKTHAELKACTPSRSQAAPVPNTLAHQAQLRSALLRAGVQPRLEIGAVNDPLEREADAAAERVMRMPEPPSPASGAGGEGKTNIIQSKASPAPTTTEASPQLESSLNSLNSGGVPLDASSRAFFEPRFGQDFSQVRLHTDDNAAQMADSLSAKAFTLGNDIAFAANSYSVDTPAGKNLLGHELAHVVQQREMGGNSPRANRVQRRSANERQALVREYRKAARASSEQAAKRVQFTKYVITNFYGRTADARAIEIAIEKSSDSWATIENEKNSSGKYPFMVNEDLFNPRRQGDDEEDLAYLAASTIGHELIHLEQISRASNISLLGINSAVRVFRELEASTWESGNSEFSWQIPSNTLYPLLHEDYKQQVDDILQQRQREVKKAVEEFHQSSLSSKYLPPLIRWLNENPWTNRVWLPANRELLRPPAERGK